ncbi:MAG: lamin tail domain-containing protein, partial [Planctomycetes bacterium]|nr:lamin tail domain-containing protein [Planctomycetota bacterium]
MQNRRVSENLHLHATPPPAEAAGVGLAVRGRLLGWAIAFSVLACGAAPRASGAVVITEIHYNPPEGSDLEFIELHNTSASPADIGGWALVRGVRYEFPHPAAIPPGGRVVVARNPDALRSWFRIDAEGLFGPSIGSLDNAGETVRLVDARGAPVDDVAYEAQPPWPAQASGGGASLERLCSDHDSNDPCNWTAAAGSSPTPLAENSRAVCPPPPLPPSAVAINEIHYHAIGDRDEVEEFVELINTTDATVDMSGWSFTRGISFTFPDGSALGPGEILVVCRDVGGFQSQIGAPAAIGDFAGQLSNSGERITLLDRQGRLVDSVRYEDS